MAPRSAARRAKSFPNTRPRRSTPRATPIQDQVRSSTQKSLGANLDKLVQPEAMEQPDPKHYNDFLQGSIQILDTLVLSIELPPAIVNAINRQTEQFYLIQEYKFRVEREAEESKRKQIEANGIAAFQQTVSKGISDSYLRWRGIEATLMLAQSPNSKIIIIGARQGRPADHPQRRDCGAGSDAAVRRERHAAAGGAGRPDQWPRAVRPAVRAKRRRRPNHRTSACRRLPTRFQAAQPSAAATPSGAPAAPAAPSRSEASAAELILSRINGALHGSAPPPATPGEELKH